MKTLEDQLQIAAMNYMRLQYPNVLAFHVANERQTSPMRGAKLKAKGVLKGVSDVIILEARGNYYGACIELKAPKGRLTDSQKIFLDRASKANYMVGVAWSFDEFKTLIDLYMKQDTTVSIYDQGYEDGRESIEELLG